MRGRSAFVLAVALAGVAQASLAESMPVPAKVQAAILKKILVYDKSLQGKEGRIKLVVVGGEKALADEIASAFREVGVTVDEAKVDELLGKLDDATIVYVMPGVPTAPVKRVLAEKKALSVTGLPTMVEKGDVAVGIGLRDDGKPQIIVHLLQLKAEGHEFSAEMLKLAKVVR